MPWSLGSMVKVIFTASFAGQKDGPKKFELDPKTAKAVKLGRAPNSDIHIPLRGASQYHAELRVKIRDDKTPVLAVRDQSMNGTGLKRPKDGAAIALKKGAEVPLPHDSEIWIPLTIKPTQSESDRAIIKIQFAGGASAFGAAQASDEDANLAESGADAGGGPPAASNAAADEDEADGNERSRMQFVDLLLKSKEVTGSTTYQEAEVRLGEEDAWKAVDAETRKECFEIFVAHLGSHGGDKKKKKKDKKEDKEKSKDKSKKRKQAEEEEEEDDGRGKNAKAKGKTRSSSRKRGRKSHRD